MRAATETALIENEKKSSKVKSDVREVLQGIPDDGLDAERHLPGWSDIARDLE